MVLAIYLNTICELTVEVHLSSKKTCCKLYPGSNTCSSLMNPSAMRAEARMVTPAGHEPVNGMGAKIEIGSSTTISILEEKKRTVWACAAYVASAVSTIERKATKGVWDPFNTFCWGGDIPK